MSLADTGGVCEFALGLAERLQRLPAKLPSSSLIIYAHCEEEAPWVRGTSVSLSTTKVQRRYPVVKHSLLTFNHAFIL